MVLKSEIEAVLRSLPQNVYLTPYGNILGRGTLVKKQPFPQEDYVSRAKEFDLGRIEAAVAQIPSIFKKTKTYGPASSYALKHTLERKTGDYVTNGDFIVAMALSGYKMKFGQEVNALIKCHVIDEEAGSS